MFKSAPNFVVFFFLEQNKNNELDKFFNSNDS